MNLRLVLYVTCVGLLLGAVAFSPSWDQWLWLRTLHDFAHGPVFGAIAVLALRAFSHMPRTARGSALTHYGWAFGFAVILGGLAELVQWRTGRDPSWADFVTDVLGIATLLLLHSLFDSRLREKRLRKWGMAGAVIGLAFMASPMIRTAHAYYERSRAFPQIIDIHHGLGSNFITTRQAKTRIEPLPTRWSYSNESALRVEFLQGKWQGVAHSEPPRDWRGYESLVVDVVNPTQVPLKIVVRIDDQHHNWRDADRYNGRFEIAPETRERLRINLSEILEAPKNREFDLARVARILVFRQNDSEAASMYLVRIGLEA